MPYCQEIVDGGELCLEYCSGEERCSECHEPFCEQHWGEINAQSDHCTRCLPVAYNELDDEARRLRGLISDARIILERAIREDEPVAPNVRDAIDVLSPVWGGERSALRDYRRHLGQRLADLTGSMLRELRDAAKGIGHERMTSAVDEAHRLALELRLCAATADTLTDAQRVWQKPAALALAYSTYRAPAMLVTRKTWVWCDAESGRAVDAEGRVYDLSIATEVAA